MQGRVALEDLAAKDRLAFWRDVVCTHLYNITPSDWPDEHAIRGAWEVQDRGQMGLADVHSSNRSRLRSARDIARDHADFVTLQRVMGQPVEYSFAADRFAMQPGDLCLFAMDWQHEARASADISLRSLEIPRALLSPLIAGGKPRRPIMLSGTSPLGALLAGGLDAAWAQMPRLGADTGEAVLRNLVGLVALAYGASSQGQELASHGVRAVRLDAAKAYAMQHLADAELSPARAATALGISLRSLHKLFEPGGESFAQFVTRRRLEACCAALTDPAARARAVTDIALGWGFASLPTFYRSFAAAFGVTPSEVRQSGLRGRLR